MTFRQILYFCYSCFVCDHEDCRRERDQKTGVLMLVCNRCDHRTVALSRTAAERREIDRPVLPVRIEHSALPPKDNVTKIRIMK